MKLFQLIGWMGNQPLRQCLKWYHVIAIENVSPMTVCIANGMKCTEMCKLSICENRNTEDTDKDELESEESDSEIDEEDDSCDL